MPFPTANKLIFQACLITLVVGLTTAPLWSQNPKTTSPKRPDDLQQLWSTLVDPMLHQNVTSGEQAQTFGTVMMVPLHAAFRLRNNEWMHGFADHFSRLAATNFSSLPTEDLGRYEYLYVASEFMVLARESGQQDLIPRTLPGLTYTDIWKYWSQKPAWQWGRNPFPGGARERVAWKLNNRQTPKNYYRSIIDSDLFVFAIAADMKAYIHEPAELKNWSGTLDDILALAHRTFSQEVVAQSGGGWLFQPGVWSDHPEYQYVGNPEIRSGMKPMPVRDIAADVSHSLRYPLWLTSLMRAYPPSSEDHHFYEGLRAGLEKQLFNKVLVRPSDNFPCYRLTNFMDGRNGVYRWNYSSVGEGGGYGPYGLSGSLLTGWWIFLDTDQIRQVYRDEAAAFPWPKQCVELYLGPTTPKGHPESDFDPSSSAMRRWYLNVKLASQM